MENTSETTKKRGRCLRAQPKLSFTQQDFDALYDSIIAGCTKKTKLPEKPEKGSTEETYHTFFMNIKAKRNPKLTALVDQFISDFGVAEGQIARKRINLSEDGKEARGQLIDEEEEIDFEKEVETLDKSVAILTKSTNRKTRGKIEQIEQPVYEGMIQNLSNQLSRSKRSAKKADETKQNNFIKLAIKPGKIEQIGIEKDESADVILDNTYSQVSSSLNFSKDNGDLIGDYFGNPFQLPQQDKQPILNTADLKEEMSSQNPNGKANHRDYLRKKKHNLLKRLQSSFPLPPSSLSQPQRFSQVRAYHEQIQHQQSQEMPYELVARKKIESKKDPEEEMRQQLSKLRLYYTGSGEYDSLLLQLFKQQDLYKNMLEKIVSKADEAVHCSICLLLPLVPLACSNCKMIICARCTFDCQVRDTCPICCIQPWGVQKLSNSDLEALVLKQHFACEYKQFGCKNTNSIEAVLPHENTCHYKANPCEFCSELIMITKMQEHVQICDQRLIDCSKCSFQFKACEASHHECISATVAHYTELKKEFHQYKLDVEDMLLEQERLINGLQEKLNQKPQNPYTSFPRHAMQRGGNYSMNKNEGNADKKPESAQKNEKINPQIQSQTNQLAPLRFSHNFQAGEIENGARQRDRFQPSGSVLQRPFSYQLPHIRQNCIIVPEIQAFPFQSFEKQSNSNPNDSSQQAPPVPFLSNPPQILNSNYWVYDDLNPLSQRGVQNVSNLLINSINNRAPQPSLFNQPDNLLQMNQRGPQQQPSQQDSNPFTPSDSFFY